jgi:Kef-type K+ transport system membrane component KefB/nucleotide-binding universal stress UspA family protein
VHVPISYPLILAATGVHGEDRVSLFFVQIVLLVVVGRLLGELMQRWGQPAVMGQLLAGIILGPSILGGILPAQQQLIFPLEASNRQMLNAVSELGILLLLLLTGMETDLALVKRVRRSAALTSAGGILIPFACGYGLGEMLPDSLLPDAHRRLLTSLFLATALSISSVKIVAAVLREVDFLRRDLGQVILASSILDDTIGWIILALIGGLAAHGTIALGPLLFSVCGTVLFLGVCLTIGKTWVARAIRWTNDNFIGEMPVISVILVITLVSALVTSFIGVHTVLGAFVAGIMIGQSPILTKHIDEQLRGMIVALFMPIFFGVAGLSVDLKVLADLHLLGLTLVIIIIASIGKLCGCYVGSRLSRLTHAESLAVGLGMNARGSTEIILATIGLSFGVLNQQLYTVIVLMAVVTTLCMPPLLRWALSRVTIREAERIRLETEEAENKELLPKIERILVGLDNRKEGDFAARLAGWLIGARSLSATAMDWPLQSEEDNRDAPASKTVIEATRQAVQAETIRRGKISAKKSTAKAEGDHPLDSAADISNEKNTAADDLVTVLKPKESTGEKEDTFAEAILREAKNGYGLLFLGTGSASEDDAFRASLQRMLLETPIPIACLFADRQTPPSPEGRVIRILVPTTGADYSRFGAEVAVAIAKGCGASITALHVSVFTERYSLRESDTSLTSGRTLVSEIEALGKREGVRVDAKALKGRAKDSAILKQAKGHQLIVIGTKSQSTEQLHFGTSAMTVIEKSACPVLIVKS